MSPVTQPVTKAQLIEQFDTVVADTEQLLKSVANAGGEQAVALRASAHQSLAKAREGLRDFQQVTVDKTRAAAQATLDDFQQHPWRTAGIAAVIGLAIGLLLHRR